MAIKKSIQKREKDWFWNDKDKVEKIKKFISTEAAKQTPEQNLEIEIASARYKEYLKNNKD